MPAICLGSAGRVDRAARYEQRGGCGTHFGLLRRLGPGAGLCGYQHIYPCRCSRYMRIPVSYTHLVYSDDPVAMAKQLVQKGASWLHIVDLDGARTGVASKMGIRDRRHGDGHRTGG